MGRQNRTTSYAGGMPFVGALSRTYGQSNPCAPFDNRIQSNRLRYPAWSTDHFSAGSTFRQPLGMPDHDLVHGFRDGLRRTRLVADC
jgi:hypothetical protein